MNANSKKGLSLIEIIVVVAIMSILLITVFGLFKVGMDSYSNQSVHMIMDGIARDVVNEMAEEIGEGNFTTVQLPSGNPGITIQFHKYTGMNMLTMQPNFSTTFVEFRWQTDPNEIPNDGLDNDGDGLIDEGKLIHVLQDGTERILVHEALANQGLQFERTNNSIIITLSLVRFDLTDTTVTRTATTTVQMRNWSD